MALLLHRAYSNQWISFIQYILNFVDLKIDVLNVKNIRTIIVRIKTKLYTKCKDLYLKKLQMFYKLNLYSSIRTTCTCQRAPYLPHLHHIKNVKYRKSVTELRLSSHKLSIESGRYPRLKRDERLCVLRKMSIASEKHCIIECLHPALSSLRNNYMSVIFNVNNNLSLLPRNTLFKYILVFADNNITDISAAYVHDNLKVYEEHL